MKILVIQQRYGIGDMVIFLPYLHALSKKLGSPITLLAKKSSNAEALFAYDEHISEIIELDKSKDGLRGFFKLAKELKSKDFDKVFIFNGSLRYFLLSKFAGIKSIYQYPLFISKDIIFQTAKIFTETFLEHPVSTQPKLKLDAEVSKLSERRNLMSKDFQHIILGVSASGPTKRWPVENYIKLAENLLKIYKCKFYLALGKNDNDIEQKIMNSKIKDACFSFANIGIKETLPIIKNADLYVGNDTGFLHISSALNINCIGIYVDSPAFSYSAYSNNIEAIVPINETILTTTHNTRGAKNISFDEVLEKVKNKLNL